MNWNGPSPYFNTKILAKASLICHLGRKSSVVHRLGTIKNVLVNKH